MTLGGISFPLLCPVVRPQQSSGWGPGLGKWPSLLTFQLQGWQLPFAEPGLPLVPLGTPLPCAPAIPMWYYPPLDSIWKRKVGFTVGPLAPDSFL